MPLDQRRGDGNPVERRSAETVDEHDSPTLTGCEVAKRATPGQLQLLLIETLESVAGRHGD